MVVTSTACQYINSTRIHNLYEVGKIDTVGHSLCYRSEILKKKL